MSRKPFLFAAAAISLAAVYVVLAFRQPASGESDELKLSQQSCKAPCTVKVIGPGLLTKLKNNTRTKWVGCSFNIDWGDNLPTSTYSSKCEDFLSHEYRSSGDFTVRATTFHPNPDDSHTIDWRGQAMIQVK